MIDFIDTIFDEDDIIEIRCFPPERDSNIKAKSYFTFAEDAEDLKAKLTKQNKKGLSIYVGVLPREKTGATKDDEVLSGKVVWADVEKTNPEDAYNKIKGNLPEPTLVINSGNGVHFYWKLKEKVIPAQLSKMVWDIAHEMKELGFNYDKSVRNPSRVMRLPSFINHKGGNKSEIWKRTDKTYTFKRLRKKIKETDYEVVDIPKAPTLTRKRSKVIDRAKSYIEKCEGVGEGERNNKAFTVAGKLVRGFELSEAEAFPLLKMWNSKNSPPISDSELYSTLPNSGRYSKEEIGSKNNEIEVEDRPTRRKGKLNKIKHIEFFKKRYELAKKAIPLLSMPCLQVKSSLLSPAKYTLIAGEPGTSKSFFALQLCHFARLAGVPWAYLPLEMEREEHIARFFAIADKDFELCNEDVGNFRRDQRILKGQDFSLEECLHGIYPNPILSADGASSMDVDETIDWVEEVASKKRLVIIDPLAQIAFSEGGKEFAEQRDFAQHLSRISRKTKSSIVLITHTTKRPEDPPTLADVEGSKRLTGLADNVLFISKEFEKEKTVETFRGDIKTVVFNRTIYKLKGRGSEDFSNGIAMSFGTTGGPNFHEHGMILRKK